jgi:glycosyltransferase involved in cell wall biosynthesis
VNLTARLGLDQRVTFMGAMPQAELAELMARAQVLVLPSLSEGLGRVLLEAMACGTPVIGSAVGGIPEIIQEGTTGFLIPPGDVGALAERLRWILQHPDQARQIGESARKFARELFSEELYVKHYSDLIQKSLS